MPSPFGEKALGIVTALNTFTDKESVAEHFPKPVAVKTYTWLLIAFKDGRRVLGLLKANPGVHKKFKERESFTLGLNVTVVPSGTINEGPASITGCRYTLTFFVKGSDIQPCGFLTVNITA